MTCFCPNYRILKKDSLFVWIELMRVFSHTMFMAQLTKRRNGDEARSSMLIKHSLIYFIARGLSGMINLLAIAAYTRLTSSGELGKYAIVVAIVSFFDVVFFRWLRLGILRFLPRYNGEKREVLLSTAFRLFFAILLIVLIISYLSMHLWIELQKVQDLWWLGLGLLFLMAWFELNMELFRADLSPKAYGLLSMGKAFLTVVFSVGFLMLGWGAKGLVLGLILGMACPLVLQLNKTWRGVRFSAFDPLIKKQLLAYGIPLMITFVMHFVITSSGRLMLAWFKGPEEVGLYSVVFDLVQQTLILVMLIINLAAFPIVVHSLEKGKDDETRGKLVQYTTIFFLVSLPAMAGFTVLSSNISYIFLGEDYRQMALIMIPLIAFTTFLEGTKYYYIDLSFQLAQSAALQIVPNIVAACVNVGLSFWWIPEYGAIGAVYAALSAYWIAVMLGWFIGRKVFVLPFPGKDVLKILVATLGMAALLEPLSSITGIVAFIGQIALGMLIYSIAVVILQIGDFNVHLINAIKKFKNRN